MNYICRRDAIASLATPILAGLVHSAVNPNHPFRIGVSTYSFWHFKGAAVPIETCLEHAADMGFDGVEILHVHMEEAAKAAGGSVNNALLHRIKQRAFALGLDLMGFSTHQGFVTPDVDKRKQNIEHTAKCLEMAHEL
ncbi:MAG: sugar phosphate isomerase/epimerase family protein, partial [Gemmataceae bacterium]